MVGVADGCERYDARFMLDEKSMDGWVDWLGRSIGLLADLLSDVSMYVAMYYGFLDNDEDHCNHLDARPIARLRVVVRAMHAWVPECEGCRIPRDCMRVPRRMDNNRNR